MALSRKHRSPFRLELTNSDQATAHGGQVAIDAFCRRFGLWKQIAAEPRLDPRTRKRSGFAPEAIVAQLIFALTGGGAAWSYAERLGNDKVLLDAGGLEQGAEQSTKGVWRRAKTFESGRARHRFYRVGVRRARDKAKKGRLLQAGQLVRFFDDTEIEVLGKVFDGARFNYQGNRALSWQTLWLGPFLLDGILDGAGVVSQLRTALLAEQVSFWRRRPSCL